MPNPATQEQFIRLLDDGLREVAVDKYPEIDPKIDTFFSRVSSDRAWEEFYEVGGVPDIPAFDGKLKALSFAPGYYTRIEPKQFGGMINIEKMLLENDRYDVIAGRQKGLSIAYQRTQEKYAVQLFAYAFSSIFTFMFSEEGVALCSSSHTTKSGASTTSGFDNAGTDAISKTSIAATRIIMRQFRNDVGARIITNPDTLVVPDNIYDDTCEAVGWTEKGASSDRDPDSAHYGRINTQYNRWNIIPYPRLDDYDTNDWFMIDSSRMKEYLKWIERLAPETETEWDFDTKMFKQSIFGVFGYGHTGWRWIYGHKVT